VSLTDLEPRGSPADGAEARPDVREKPVEPSIWPLLAAISVGATFLYSIFSPWAVVYGAGPIALTLIGWFWPKGTPEDELMMAVAAPLIAAAAPGGALIWALPAGARGLFGRAAHGATLAGLWEYMTHPPVATILHGLAIWVWHVPGLFEPPWCEVRFTTPNTRASSSRRWYSGG
jgi:hypothetical protein